MSKFFPNGVGLRIFEASEMSSSAWNIEHGGVCHRRQNAAGLGCSVGMSSRVFALFSHENGNQVLDYL